MPRPRAMLLAALATVFTSAPPAVAATAVVHDFSRDPLSPGGPLPVFSTRGAAEAFVQESGTDPRFAGDRRGSLAVTYDSTTARVLRGGSWNLDYPDDFLASDRISRSPDNRFDSLGFRCAGEVVGGVSPSARVLSSQNLRP